MNETSGTPWKTDNYDHTNKNKQGQFPHPRKTWIPRIVQTFLLFISTVPPQGAEIQGPLQPFTCSRDYYIVCKVWGSNPPARIEWFRGTSPNHGLRPLKAHNQTVTQGGNVTISWLHYQPKAGHHHQTLICRGSNDDLMTATSQTVEDYHRMEIFCKF